MELVNHLEGRLLFAVPKKGRLQQTTLDLLSGSDIQFHRENRLDIALVKNFEIALVFLPAADIPTFVGEGRVDLGITGRDQVAEHEAITSKSTPPKPPPSPSLSTTLQEAPTSNSSSALTQPSSEGGGKSGEGGGGGSGSGGLEEVLDLGFGRCSLQVQVPERGDIGDPRQLIGRTVVTSFTGLTARYFAALEGVTLDEGDLPLGRKLKTKITFVGGSVEAACALGVADGVVDLVESGETMRAAGLKAIDTVCDSTAVLIKSKNSDKQGLVELIASRIRGVINAKSYVLCQYNVPREMLQRAVKVTPGRRAPTVTALDEPDWVAVSSMVKKKDIANVMDELTQIGAKDILALTIMNSRADSLD